MEFFLELQKWRWKQESKPPMKLLMWVVACCSWPAFFIGSDWLGAPSTTLLDQPDQQRIRNKGIKRITIWPKYKKRDYSTYHDNKARHGKLRSRVNVTEGFVSEREQQVRLGKQNKHWKYQNSPLCHFSCKDCKDHFIFSSALWEIKQLWLYVCMNRELNWFKVAIMEIEMRWRWPCMTQMLKI